MMRLKKLWNNKTMLTTEQQTNIIKAAKDKNPNVTFEESKALLTRANELSGAKTAPTEKEKNSWLPIIGGIIGGFGGSFLGPAGTIAGAGIGAGAGTMIDSLTQATPKSQLTGKTKYGFPEINEQGKKQQREDINRGITNIGNGMMGGSAFELAKQGASLLYSSKAAEKTRETVSKVGTSIRKGAVVPVGNPKTMGYQENVVNQSELKKEFGFLGSPSTSSQKLNNVRTTNGKEILKILGQDNTTVKTKDLTLKFTKLAQDKGIINMETEKLIDDPTVEKARNFLGTRLARTPAVMTQKDLYKLIGEIGDNVNWSSSKAGDQYLKDVYFELESMLPKQTQSLITENNVLRQVIQSYNQTSKKGGPLLDLGAIKIPGGQVSPTVKDWFGSLLESANKKPGTASDIKSTLDKFSLQQTPSSSTVKATSNILNTRFR